jgi:hypothetical protein
VSNDIAGGDEKAHSPKNAPKKEKSPRREKKSPRVRVEKEIVHVEVHVERIPEEHLNRQKVG